MLDALPPRAIARRLAVPTPTVKSRLARGLARLRPRVERDFARCGESWRDALALLTGLPLPASLESARLDMGPAPEASTAPAALGALALGAAPKLAALGAAAALLAVAFGSLPRPTLNEPAATADAARASLAGAASSGATSRRTDELSTESSAVAHDERRALGAEKNAGATSLAAPEEGTFTYRVSGILLDENDVPLVKAQVYLAPHLHALNRVAITDSSGRFDVSFLGRSPVLDLVFTAEHAGRWLGLRELSARSGEELQVRAGFPSGGDDQRVSSSIGSRREGSVEENFGEEIVFVGALDLGIPEALGAAFELWRDERGVGAFVEEPLHGCERVRDLRVFVSQVAWLEEALKIRAEASAAVDLRLWLQTYQASEFSALTGETAAVGPPAEAPPQAELRGFVLDALGEPIPDALVGFGARAAAFSQSVRTDGEGAFVLGPIPEGELFFRAGGGDHGIAATRLEVRAGDRLSWTARLDRGEELLGRLTDEKGRPLSGWTVEIASVDPLQLWSDVTRTREDGRFAIPNCPRLAFEVLAYPQESGLSSLPVRAASEVWPGQDLGDLQISAGERRSSLELAVLDAEGEHVPGAEVRLWNVDLGRGFFVERTDDERFRSAGLATGNYCVHVGSRLGWRDLGVVWLPDGECVDLSEVRFEAPGAALLSVASDEGVESSEFELAMWRERGDVFSLCWAERSTEPAQRMLVPGGYRLDVRSGTERASSSFQIRPSSAVGLEIALGSAGAIEIRQGEPPSRPPALDAMELEQQSCAACHAPGD